MKKIFALILAIVMMAAISVPVFADTDYKDSEDSVDFTNTTKVTYGVDQTYTVTIPESITVDKVTLKGKAVITASEVYIPAGAYIKVSVTSKNTPTGQTDGVTNAWELKATAGSTADPVGYTVTEGESNVLARGDIFLTAASAATFEAVNKTLNIQVNKTMQVAVYEDYLTFSVAIGALNA